MAALIVLGLFGSLVLFQARLKARRKAAREGRVAGAWEFDFSGDGDGDGDGGDGGGD